MALDAVAPRAFGVRSAEDRDVVELRVTRKGALRPFHVLQHLFQAHDGGGLHCSALAEAAGQQCVGQMTFHSGHFFDRKTFAIMGNEDPVAAFFVTEAESCFGLLFGGKCGQEMIRRIGHVFDRRRAEQRQTECEENGQELVHPPSQLDSDELGNRKSTGFRALHCGLRVR